MNMLDNTFLDSRFLFPNTLTYLGDFLTKFSENASFPVAVRSIEPAGHIKKLKILIYNKPSSLFWGLADHEQATEVCAFDLYERLPTFERDAHIQQAKKETESCLHCQSIDVKTQVTLNHDGFVCVFKRVLTPILGSKNQNVAVCITSIESTQYISLVCLFDIYRKYYQKKSQAIGKFSQYLGLDIYFLESLTCSELKTLLMMEKGIYQYKQIAAQRGRSPNTIHSQIDSMKDKLKTHMTLSKVISSLRSSRHLSHSVIST